MAQNQKPSQQRVNERQKADIAGLVGVYGNFGKPVKKPASKPTKKK